jgi:predicted transcriptional regulator
MRQRAIRVTAGEMELLAMLWSEGALTLRQAHQRFGDYGQPIGYPTMQTRLNRMVGKGLVGRSDERPAGYEANVTREQVTLGHLRQIVAKLSRGDVVPLVARLLSEQTLTPEQLDELQQLLKQAQQKTRAQTKSQPTTKRRRSS